jgi:hypothetical protein
MLWRAETGFKCSGGQVRRTEVAPLMTNQIQDLEAAEDNSTLGAYEAQTSFREIGGVFQFRGSGASLVWRQCGYFQLRQPI